ncbi:hypothetical protein BC936DRAFT_139138, partial [Jimgerdemannia flammicorona]
MKRRTSLDHHINGFACSSPRSTILPEKPPKKDAKKDANKDVPMADAKDDDDDREHPCLVRAVYKKTKISTLVHASNTDRFQFNYGNIVKVHMDSLKKKDRKAKTALKKRTANKKPKAT